MSDITAPFDFMVMLRLVAAAAAGIALVNAFVSLGGFVGPLLIGVLNERSGKYASAMAMLAVGLVLGALIVLALGRAMRRRPLLATLAKGS